MNDFIAQCYSKQKKENHTAEVIVTDTPNWMEWTPEKIIEAINKALDKINKADRCPNCGSLQPEIILEHGGKSYFFTCTEINNKKGDILTKTDLTMFKEYLIKRGY